MSLCCETPLWCSKVCFEEIPLWALLVGKTLMWALRRNLDFPPCVPQPNASSPHRTESRASPNAPVLHTVQTVSFGRAVGSRGLYNRFYS